MNILSIINRFPTVPKDYVLNKGDILSFDLEIFFFYLY